MLRNLELVLVIEVVHALRSLPRCVWLAESSHNKKRSTLIPAFLDSVREFCERLLLGESGKTSMVWALVFKCPTSFEHHYEHLDNIPDQFGYRPIPVTLANT